MTKPCAWIPIGSGSASYALWNLSIGRSASYAALTAMTKPCAWIPIGSGSASYALWNLSKGDVTMRVYDENRDYLEHKPILSATEILAALGLVGFAYGVLMYALW